MGGAGAETKVGVDKAAQGVGLGGNVSSFALLEANIFYFMFSEITVLSMLAIII